MTDLGIYIGVKAEGADRADTYIKKVSRSAGKLEKDAKGASKGVDELSSSLGKSSTSASESSQALGALSKVLATVASVAAARKVISIADDFSTMSNRVKLATSSLQEYNYVQSHLLRTANKAGRSLAEMQNIFIDTNGNLLDMNYSMSDALKITDSFSLALARNATSAQKAASA